MQNNYLLEGTDFLVLLKKEKEIIEKNHFENQYQAIYDLEECDLSLALEDLDTYSLLSSKKVIIIRNILFSQTDKNISHLLSYIENSSPDNLLIMTSLKLDNRSRLVKEVKTNKNIQYLKIEMNPKQFVKTKLNSYQISEQDINYLLQLCKEDITKLDSECDKLMNYKIKSKQITKEDIDQLVVEKLGDSTEVLYSMVNSIMNKDKKKALLDYKTLQKYQMDIYSMIGLLASQIKLIHQVKLLKDDNLSNQEIKDLLGVKSVYQIQKMAEYGNLYSYQDIYHFTHLLADTDFKIKTGKIDPSIAMELLIISQLN